jgi:FkbM family methyltransferase
MINIPTHNLGHYNIPTDCKKLTCVDIGANVGDFVGQSKNIFELVHFYEPYRPCYDLVCFKHRESNIIGHNEAVYSSDGVQLPLIAHKNRDAGSNALKTDSINEHWTQELHKVTTVSLPTIIARIGGHVNYMKVDCETSEYHLFLNQDLTNIDYIGMELHWQIGKEKYDNLIQHMLITHTTTDIWDWKEEQNLELLFRNKRLQ